MSWESFVLIDSKLKACVCVQAVVSVVNGIPACYMQIWRGSGFFSMGEQGKSSLMYSETKMMSRIHPGSSESKIGGRETCWAAGSVVSGKEWDVGKTAALRCIMEIKLAGLLQSGWEEWGYESIQWEAAWIWKKFRKENPQGSVINGVGNGSGRAEPRMISGFLAQ